MNIDYILNGNRKPKKAIRDPLMDLFSMKAKKPTPNILGDRITKSQRQAIKKAPFGDWDKDMVINGLDCQPRNSKRHNVRGRLLDKRIMENALVYNIDRYGSKTNINNEANFIKKRIDSNKKAIQEIKDNEYYRKDNIAIEEMQKTAIEDIDDINNRRIRLQDQINYRREMKKDNNWLKTPSGNYKKILQEKQDKLENEINSQIPEDQEDIEPRLNHY